MIFKPSTKMKSYIFPITKIILFICLLIVLFFRDKLFNIEHDVFPWLFYAIILTIIWCIYISIAELFLIHDKRENDKIKTSIPDIMKCVTKSIEELVELVDNNDIVDIIIVCNDMTVNVGDSSEFNSHSGNFFDKCLYVGEKIYGSIKDFEVALKGLTKEDFLYVYSIDGIVVNGK